VKFSQCNFLVEIVFKTFKKRSCTGQEWWLTPVISAMWEAEIRKIAV
jgi:hypothetical protein